MKKLIFFLCAFLCAISSKADIDGFKLKNTDDQTSMGLYLCFSQVDSKYEDDNIILQIYNSTLWITNKTNRPLFVDASQSFIMLYGEVEPLYDTTVKNAHEASKNDNLITLAPKQTRQLVSVTNFLYGTYSVYDANKEYKIVNDNTVAFTETIDKLYNEIVHSQVNNASCHFTETESFVNLSASIVYSLNKSFKDEIDAIVSTWVSEVVIAKSYVSEPPEEDKVRTLKAQGAKHYFVLVGASSPFEYDEDRSPIMGGHIIVDIKKSKFILSPFLENQGYGEIIWMGDDVDFSKIVDNGTSVLIGPRDNLAYFDKLGKIFSRKEN